MRFAILLSSLSSILFIAGCGKDDTDTSVTDTSDSSEDTSGTVEGFSVQGVAANLMTSAPAPEGLCVYVADPTQAIAGGEIEILAGSTVGANGAYQVDGVVTTSAVGLLMLVQDCDTAATALPTATGISKATYDGLGTGDIIADRTIYTIDSTTAGGMNAMLGAQGYTGDIAVDGTLLGFVFDATGAPIAGATIGGPDGFPTYYYTGADFSGTATMAETNAMFAVPAGPIYSYECTATGYTFDKLLAGSQPGYAVIVSFNAL